MKLKFIAIFTLLISICLFTIGCKIDENTSDAVNKQTYVPSDTVIYQSDNVKFSLEEVPVPENIHEYELMPETTDNAYSTNPVIIVGTVSNVKQGKIEYSFMDSECEDHITIFDVKISKILRDDDNTLAGREIVTVGIPYNMTSYGAGLPIIKADKEFLIYCYDASTVKDDILEMAQYLDFWAKNPWQLVVEKSGSCYITNNFFDNVPTSKSILNILGESESKNETDIMAEKLCGSVFELDAQSAKSVANILNERIAFCHDKKYITENLYLANAECLEDYIRGQIDNFLTNNGQ